MRQSTKNLLLYALQRIALMVLTFLAIFVLCFFLIRLLPLEKSVGPGQDIEMFYMQQVHLGRMYLGSDGEYHAVPLFTQLWNFIKNLFVPSVYVGSDGLSHSVSRFGYSWQISYLATPDALLFSRMTPTILVNLYSVLIAIPFGILFGVLMALHKGKAFDRIFSLLMMLFISVPSFVLAFLLQYVFSYQLGWLPSVRADFEGNWFSGPMLRSMILPVLAMALSTLFSFARFTRAELSEILTSDYMFLSRAKGLSKGEAVWRHGLRNAMVPIFPMIFGEVIGVLSGSIIIENIFAINGVGSLLLDSITKKDYDVFQFVGMFYVFIGLLGSLIVDLSYGIIDPRIRIGGKKDEI